MKTETQLRAEFDIEVKKMGTKIDLSLAIIRAELVQLEIIKSDLRLKTLSK